MESSKLSELLDHQRWLLNNGLVNDSAKNNLYMYGTIVHKDIRAAELAIDVENKVVAYTLFVDVSLLKRVYLFRKLSSSRSLWDLWRLKRLLKKEGASLDFQSMLNRFVRDFCGPKWAATVTVNDVENYKEDYSELEGGQDTINVGADQQPDKR